MVDQSRLHEMDIYRLKEEIHILQEKIHSLEDTEDMLIIYREKYNEAVNDLGSVKMLEKEISKLQAIVG